MAKSRDNDNLFRSGFQRVHGPLTRVGSGIRQRPKLSIALGVALVGAAIAVPLAVIGAPDWEILDPVTSTVAGKPTFAELRARVKQEPKNGEAWLELGHAHWEAGRKISALRSYDRALSLEPALGSARVTENAVSCFGEKCQAEGAGLLVEHRLTDAGDQLEELTRNKRYTVRAAAVRVLEKLSLRSKIDYVAVYKLDLQSSDCDVKRNAVSRLGKVGDRRAIGAIRAARKKEAAETAWYERDCIGGRAEDAEEQILARK